MYTGLKHLHMLCAVLSIIGFIIRGGMRLADSPALQRKFFRIAPHIIDTVLLASAIGLLFTLQMNPLTQSWLIAKIIGLVLYIALGLVVMRFASTRAIRATAYVAAIVVFGYLLTVARLKTPIPFIG
jgi:uncharacterized membrane protein SirB2